LSYVSASEDFPFAMMQHNYMFGAEAAAAAAV